MPKTTKTASRKGRSKPILGFLCAAIMLLAAGCRSDSAESSQSSVHTVSSDVQDMILDSEAQDYSEIGFGTENYSVYLAYGTYSSGERTSKQIISVEDSNGGLIGRVKFHNSHTDGGMPYSLPESTNYKLWAAELSDGVLVAAMVPFEENVDGDLTVKYGATLYYCSEDYMDIIFPENEVGTFEPILSESGAESFTQKDGGFTFTDENGTEYSFAVTGGGEDQGYFLTEI